MHIKEKLVKIFQTRNAGPFLFVGSGFSRRYLGLEDWKSLLSKYCISGQPFEYYLASGDGTYPTAARHIAEDFNKIWWAHEDYAESRDKHSAKVTDKSSALRIEISQYLSKIDNDKINNNPYADELSILSNLNVDGIITTNWDCFLEQIFPDYKVFTGQNELLFSNPQSIGEIYKIHGSCHKPKSLVLTDLDYQEFNEKNAYLAAKLITLFVEHPVVFIGYSLSDTNISALISAISRCIGKDKIDQLRQNLIFIQRLDEGEEETLSDTYISIDSVQIPIVLVKTNDFASVYLAIDETKRKIPARILRYCKEQLYNLVQSNEPEKKICVVDIDDVDSHRDIEFVVGVGVAAEKRAEQVIGEKGYDVISLCDLCEDVIFNDKEYDSDKVIQNVVPSLGRYSKNIPIYMYLNKLGITDNKALTASGLQLDKWLKTNPNEFQAKSNARSYVKNHKNKNTEQIIQTCTPENAAMFLPFLKHESIDLPLLREFIVKNFHKISSEKSSYASYYKKLICLYDKLTYGW